MLFIGRNATIHYAPISDDSVLETFPVGARIVVTLIAVTTGRRSCGIYFLRAIGYSESADLRKVTNDYQYAGT